MKSNLTPEQKKERIETLAKIAGLCVAGFLFAPFAAATISGLASLLVVLGVGLVVVNVGVPWAAVTLANWRLKAIKAAAAANPIETLENQYQMRKTALLGQRDSIKQLIATAANIKSQIDAYKERFKKESPRKSSYDTLNLLIEASKGKYELAMKNLAAFGDLIEEKRADWEIVKSMAEAGRLAQVGQDFINKLMQDTALNTVQNGVNLAFAELDASVMDENIAKAINGQDVVVTPALPQAVLPAVKPKQVPNELSFDYNGSAPADRQKIAV